MNNININIIQEYQPLKMKIDIYDLYVEDLISPNKEKILYKNEKYDNVFNYYLEYY